ncbi:hypothetical protein Syun_011982 [Stephania yunnanensis]|uniref:Uncharacterized protein n=1 Tax=Stephania yunnanensis TaxID=152371 RepID=A0AAP0PFZ6_9MAGN
MVEIQNMGSGISGWSSRRNPPITTNETFHNSRHRLHNKHKHNNVENQTLNRAQAKYKRKSNPKSKKITQSIYNKKSQINDSKYKKQP